MAEDSLEQPAAGRDAVARETWRSPANRLCFLALLCTAALGSLGLLSDESLGLGTAARFAAVIPTNLLLLWLGLYVLFRPRQTWRYHQRTDVPPTPPDAYAACGLGPQPEHADAAQLYLDQVKRGVANILYEDPPLWFYDHRKRPQLAAGFSLLRRVHGEDSPTAAHTMIGLRRLEQLQRCVEEVLGLNVPGDLIETGSYRGGATIFMRAILKAHRVQDRRIFVCDTFVPPSPPPPPVAIMPVIQALASLPGRTWQRRFFLFLQRLPKTHQAFPDTSEPADDLVQFLLWNLQNPVGFNQPDRTSLDAVRSHFARYGLLDDQVVFLKGFFADTLPAAPIHRLAVARLDGDTYESTRDALVNLYPKLSPGGYLIVDDYGSFDDCRRAVDAYRQEHRIDDPVQPIDQLAICWRKS